MATWSIEARRLTLFLVDADAQEHEEVADDEMEDVAGGGVGGHDHEPHGKKKGKAAPGKRHNSTRSNRGA